MNYDTVDHVLWPYDKKVDAPFCTRCGSEDVFITKHWVQVCRCCWHKKEV